MAFSDYENALKSLIHDDDKLVTYKWISKEFEIHVNVAKDILKQYYEKYRNDESIVATFLLIGQLKDGSIRVEVVKESNLEVAEEKFIKVNCKHLYSLQKSLEDVELLAFAGEGDLRYSAIKINENFVRSDDEIDSLRYVGNAKKEEPKTAGISKASIKVPEKQESKNTTASTNEKKSKNVKETNGKEKTQIDTNKKKGITEKEKSSEKEKSNEPKSETKVSPTEKKVEKKVSPPSKSSTNTKSNSKTSKKPVQSKQSGFNNLFGKVQAKPQVSNKTKEDTKSDEKKSSELDNKEKEELKTKEETKRKEETKIKEGTKSKDQKIEQKEKENSQEKENRNKQDKKEKKSTQKAENKIDNKSKSKNAKDVRGQKRNRSKESNTASKRKRIVIADSSDDESNKSNEEEEEEEPMEIVEEAPRVARKRSLSPPAEKRENGKRMVRKTIDKTFKDEDGYLVTKRVHVYEAVSDDDGPVEVKKEESKKAKAAETKVETKKKQTSLMSFFKKS